MPDRKPYRLANLLHTVPQPDRGGQMFPQTEEGALVDIEDAFYRTLIADGDLIPVAQSQPGPVKELSTSRADPPPAAAGAPAGRATRRDAKSGLRPSADN